MKTMVFEWGDVDVGGRHFQKVAIKVPLDAERQIFLQLDTGAPSSYIYADAISKLQVEGILRKADRPGEYVLRVPTRSGSVWEIVAWEFCRRPSSDDSNGEGVVGVIGLDALQKEILVIDYPQQIISVLAPGANLDLLYQGLNFTRTTLTRVTHAKGTSHYGINVDIDGKAAGLMLLDTGAGLFNLVSWPSHTDEAIATRNVSVEAFNLSGEYTLEGDDMSFVELQGRHQVCLIGFCIQDVLLHEQSKAVIPEFQGIIGNEFFWEGVLLIDFPQLTVAYGRAAS